MAAKKSKSKPQKEQKEGGGSSIRDALFALFEKRGVEVDDTSDEVVMAESKKHGKVLSHNNVVKYRSVFRKAHGLARPKKPAKPAKTKSAKAAKPAAKPAKLAKPAKAKPASAPGKIKAVKRPKRSNGAADGPDESSVTQLLESLEQP